MGGENAIGAALHWTFLIEPQGGGGNPGSQLPCEHDRARVLIFHIVQYHARVVLLSSMLFRLPGRPISGDRISDNACSNTAADFEPIVV